VNEHDLFDALSMIDPKYIDEAAFELRDGKTSDGLVDITQAESKSTPQKNVNKIRKMLYIALPSAAAILLIVGVAIPAIMRVSKGESATAESAAAYSEAAEDSAPMAEAAEAAKDSETTGGALNDTLSLSPDLNAAPASEEAEAPAEYDLESEAEAQAAEESTYAAEAEPVTIQLEDAEYINGELSVTIANLYGKDPALIAYSITRTGTDGTDEILKEGFLDSFTNKNDRYVLDVSDLKLEKGKYTLCVEDSKAEFEVP